MDEMRYFLVALKKRLSEYGVPESLAAQTGMSSSYFSQIKSGKKENPSRDAKRIKSSKVSTLEIVSG